MNLKFVKLSELAVTPTKAHSGDAGYDLYSIEDYVLSPFERKLFKTNIAIAIPEGYYGRIADRSGNALKKGLHVLGGVVDSTYRGDVGVILLNTDRLGPDRIVTENKDFIIDSPGVKICKGDKMAQIIITPCPHFELEEIKDLNDTTRGEKGYGSSGN